MSRLTIIGIGPGSAEYFMPAARNRMWAAHTVIAARRILPMLREVCGAGDGGTAGGPVQNRGDLAAAGGAIGVEGGVAGAVHHAVVPDIDSGLREPVVRIHIGKASVLQAGKSRDAETARQDEGQQQGPDTLADLHRESSLYVI